MKRLALISSRLLWFVPTLFGLIALVFTISHIIPSDPVKVIAGDQATAEQIEQLRVKLGFDQPLWVQFLKYIGQVVQGDLGMSLFSQRPIVEDLMARLPATLELGILAVILAVLIGVPMGVISALYRNTLLDHVMRIISVCATLKLDGALSR